MNQTRKPSSPGDIIRAHYLEPLNLDVGVLAQNLAVPVEKLASIIDGATPVDAEMAIRLSLALSTTPELWLNLQARIDLWIERQNASKWSSVKQLPIPDAEFA